MNGMDKEEEEYFLFHHSEMVAITSKFSNKPSEKLKRVLRNLMYMFIV
jgi:hypothetical protein